VAEQLTAFGIKTTDRLITFTQLTPDTQAGNFQMVIQGWVRAIRTRTSHFVADSGMTAGTARAWRTR
jgi:hypothetical protein